MNAVTITFGKLVIFYILCNSICYSLAGDYQINTFKGADIEIPCSHSNVVAQNTRPTTHGGHHHDRFNFWIYKSGKADRKEVFIAINKLSQPEHEIDPEFEKNDVIFGIGGSEEPGTKCHFPFTYQKPDGTEVTSFTCTEMSELNNARCWCSPLPVVTDKYMFCPCATNKPGFTVVVVDGRNRGRACKFPFYHDRVLQYSCVRGTNSGVGDGIRCWCVTEGMYVNQAKTNWGYCSCASKSIRGKWTSWAPWSRCNCGQISFRLRFCMLPRKLTHLPIGADLLCFGNHSQVKFCDCSQSQLKDRDFASMMNIRKKVLPTPKQDLDGNLTLRNVAVSDSGRYICIHVNMYSNYVYRKDNRDVFGAYQINVIDIAHGKFLNADKRERWKYVSHPPYYMNVEWDDWQQCDRCGLEAGEQKRIGFCYLYWVTPSAVTRITCGVKEIADWKDKPTDHVVVRSCRRTCPDPDVLFRYPVSEGFSDFPPPPRKALREFMPITKGDNITLTCPFAHPNLPVSWTYYNSNTSAQLAKLLRYPPSNESEELPRYLVTLDDSLKIQDLRILDTGFYNCHVDLKLMASYSLSVEEKGFDWQIFNYILYGGAGLLLFTFAVYLIPELKKNLSEGYKKLHRMRNR